MYKIAFRRGKITSCKICRYIGKSRFICNAAFPILCFGINASDFGGMCIEYGIMTYSAGLQYISSCVIISCMPRTADWEITGGSPKISLA